MSIIFHGGLPRSGKSFEAMVHKIIPALQKGREVVAYIEGLNFERIAEASGLPLERVQELLHPLTREDMRSVTEGEGRYQTVKDGPWLQKTRDNALHVFDEAQNWWPHRHKASEELTQFVTEHGHRGIDIVLMGQALPDVLALWRRRVDQRLEFLKLTGFGSSSRYSVTVYKGKGGEKYDKVTTKVHKYEKKYFGTYASHVSDDTNKDNLVDKRSTIWNSSLFTFWIPLAVIGACIGAWKLYSFFKPPQIEVQATPAAAAAAPSTKPNLPISTPVQTSPQNKPSPQEKYFSDLSDKARIRLAGLIVFQGKTQGIVEWIDGGEHVLERIELMQLRDMGVSVMQVGQSVRLTLGDWQQIATMWPLDVPARVPDAINERLKPRESRYVASAAPVIVQLGPQPPDSVGGEFVRQNSYN